MVRFPGVYRALAALGQRLLSPRSRLRRAYLRRTALSAYDAATRRDDELVLVRYAPDFEVEFDPDFEPLGLGGTFRGHDGFVRMIDMFTEPWSKSEFEPVAVIDMGDGRFVGLNRIRVLGIGSGVELERDFVQFVTVRDGLIARDREFLSWEKGLRAAGLDPDTIVPSLRAD